MVQARSGGDKRLKIIISVSLTQATISPVFHFDKVPVSNCSRIRKTKKGFTDKRATEDLAREIEVNIRRIKEGLVDKQQQARELSAKAPIIEHLDAFEKSISKNGNTGKHVKLTMTRVRRLVREAEFKTLGDIDIELIESVLGDMLDAEEIGHKTYNHYVQAIDQFCNWPDTGKVRGLSSCGGDTAK